MVLKRQEKKKSILITINPTLHTWMKENIYNLSAFFEDAGMKHSSSFCSGSNSQT